MGRAVVIAMVAFALGLAAGVFLRPGSEPRAVEERAAEDPPANPAPADNAGKVEGRAVRSSDRAVADLIASVPVPAVERGQGTITGVVRTDAGERLAGVRVRANRFDEDRPPQRRNATEEPNLEEVVRSFIEEARWRRANRWEATSGEDGSFALSGLPQAGYSIEGSKEGYEISNAARMADSARPGDSVELLARAVIEVPIRVLMPDGSPAKQAQVLARRPGINVDGDREESRNEWSLDRPSVKLRAGTHHVRAYQGEHRELSSDEEELVLEAGAKAPPLTLQLKDRPGIRGQILYQEGDPFRNGDVRLTRMQPASPPDPSRLCDQQTYTHIWGQTEDTSSFTFTDLVSGRYLLGLSRGSGRILATAIVEVAGHMVTVDLAMPALQRSDYLVLWVYGSQGRVLPEVEVSTGLRAGLREASSDRPGEVRRPDGSRWVLHQELCGRVADENAVNSVTVQASGFPEKTVEYSRAQTSELVLHLTEPGFLEVTLTGFSPGDYEGSFRLSLVEAVEGGLEDQASALEAIERRMQGHLINEGEETIEGTTRFGPIDPGTYKVHLMYENGPIGSVLLQTQAVTIQAGKNSLALPVPRLFTLTVSVGGSALQAHLQAQVQARSTQRERESWGRSAEVGTSRRVALDGLLPDEYKVTLELDGEAVDETVVTVPAQTEVQLQARNRDVMRVVVIEPDSTLAKAGLQAGDLVVAVNGAKFEGAREWWELTSKVSRQKEITLLVEREAQSFEVTVPARDFQRGCTLQHASR